MSLRIKKGDTVLVLSGKDKGATGKVLSVEPETGRAIVENVNFVKRHERQRDQQHKGGIVEKEAPIGLSKIMVVCPKCGKNTRIGTKVDDDGSRARVCKKCGALL